MNKTYSETWRRCFAASGVGEITFIETPMNTKGYINDLNKTVTPIIAK